MISNGIDVVKISRIEESVKNKTFLNRVFTNEEKEYFNLKNNAPQTIAGVFAAKEAFFKAIGKGIGHIPFTDISVSHDVLGKPFFKFYSKAEQLVQKRKLQVALSISHDADIAVASVYILGENMYKTVIFDLDGTLIDTSESVLTCAKYAGEKLGAKIPDDKTMRLFLGPPLSESFAKILKIKPDKVEKAIEIYREKYEEEKFNATVYDGIFDLLETLKAQGVNLAVATLKQERFAQIVIEHFRLNKYFKMVCGPSDDNESKKEILIGKILKEFGSTPEEAVLIGDGKYDALGSKAAGVDFIAVNYGFAKEGDFDGVQPVSFVNSPKEIAYYL